MTQRILSMCKKTLWRVVYVYIDNDKYSSHIEKHTVTMLSQHYRSSDRSKCITTIYQQCLPAMSVFKKHSSFNLASTKILK
jgi:hypothetical protein